MSYPLIDRTFAWLEAHWPEEGETVLNWGDARVGNILYRDFAPIAVLDWEMATVGPREVDLAWMIFLHEFFHDMAVTFGLPGMTDFMQRDSVIAEYEELTGHTVRNLDWFEVFAALRFAIVSIRTSKPRRRVRNDGRAGRPRRPRHVPRPARKDGRRRQLLVEQVTQMPG